MAKELKFVLVGRTPSKKNSMGQFFNPKTKRMVSYYNKAYKEWTKEKMAELALLAKEKFEGRISITFHWYMPDNRSADTNNKEESVLDLLVDSEVIKDDNWKVVAERHSYAMGIDRLHPRCEVNIVSLEDTLL